jgi:hypothetical protein
MDKERKAAAEAMRQSATAEGEMATLATTPTQMREIYRQSRALRRQGAASDVEAAELAKKLYSTGQQRMRFQYGELQGIVPDVPGFAGGVSSLYEGFGKEISPHAAMNLALAGARASQSMPAEFAEQAGLSAALVRGAGTRLSAERSAAEYAGWLSVSSRVGGAGQAATRLGGLADIITKKGFGGYGLEAGVTAISEKIGGRSEAAQRTFFGRKEAFTEYKLTMGSLEERRASTAAMGRELRARPGEGAWAATVAMRDVIPELRAERLERQAAAGKAVEDRAIHAAKALERSRAVYEIHQASRDRGETGVFRQWRVAGAEKLGKYGAEGKMMARAAGALTNASSRLEDAASEIPQVPTLNQVRDYGDRK